MVLLDHQVIQVSTSCTNRIHVNYHGHTEPWVAREPINMDSYKLVGGLRGARERAARACVEQGASHPRLGWARNGFTGSSGDPGVHLMHQSNSCELSRAYRAMGGSRTNKHGFIQA